MTGEYNSGLNPEGERKDVITALRSLPVAAAAGMLVTDSAVPYGLTFYRGVAKPPLEDGFDDPEGYPVAVLVKSGLPGIAFADSAEVRIYNASQVTEYYVRYDLSAEMPTDGLTPDGAGMDATIRYMLDHTQWDPAAAEQAMRMHIARGLGADGMLEGPPDA
jgi:hypothetical protein